MSFWTKKINDALLKNNELTNRLIDGFQTSGMSNQASTKQPLNTLSFEKLLDSPVMGFSIYDGKHYIMDEQGTIQVYNDITVDDTPVETGTTLNNLEGQSVVRLVVTRQGVIVSRNNDDDTCELLYAPDIHSEFTTTYTSPEDTEKHSFSSGFGLKVHDNGQHVIVFAGVYGRGASEKDLLLSTDGGQTYTVVNKTRVIEPVPYNTHWHDVEIDPYHGFLWASQGDGEASRQVIFSRNLGESWETLIENTDQPTAVIAFPNRVVFGRDGKTAGLDSVVKPKLLTDKMNFQPQFELQDVPGQEYYAHSPVKSGGEGYVAFSVFPERNPAMIWATGDFGETWYSVHMGDRSYAGDGFIDKLVGIDEENIFGVGTNHGGGLNNLYYSKKVEWQ